MRIPLSVSGSLLAEKGKDGPFSHLSGVSQNILTTQERQEQWVIQGQLKFQPSSPPPDPLLPLQISPAGTEEGVGLGFLPGRGRILGEATMAVADFFVLDRGGSQIPEPDLSTLTRRRASGPLRALHLESRATENKEPLWVLFGVSTGNFSL